MADLHSPWLIFRIAVKNILYQLVRDSYRFRNRISVLVLDTVDEFILDFHIEYLHKTSV